MTQHQNNTVELCSRAITNLKVGEDICRRARNFFVPSIFWLYLQLVILESAFVMVSTLLSVSCLLFFSRYQHSKLGADVPFELPASFTITNSPSRAKWNYSRISLVKNPR